jgi:DNA-binding transcriptional ArsR family regulator
MLAYVPVVFDVYRPLKPHLRWTLQCLVGFADHAGRCFPSIRKLAEVTGLSKSTIARHLTELGKAGVLTRQRRPGGVYIYRIEARFLPGARVSHARRAAVPHAIGKEEQPIKKSSFRSDSVLPGNSLSTAPWKQRLQGWQKSRFWLPQWGPKPGEPGCFAPASVIP